MDERNLRLVYGRESDSALENALRLGPGAYTGPAWQILNEEAARRGLSSAGTASPPEEEYTPPPLIHSVGLMPGRLAVWVGVLAWMDQVIHFGRILTINFPLWLVDDRRPNLIVHTLLRVNFYGLVALVSGLQATRSPFARLGWVIIVVSLGLIVAESAYYLVGAFNLRLF
jgi:hypothetical protein